MEQVYKKNEFETNEIVSKAIRIVLLLVLVCGVLCWINVFDITNHLINKLILLSIIPLIIPTILVDIFHVNKAYIKYIIILCISVVTGIAYSLFTFQTILIFIIPTIIAAFYLDKEVMLYAGNLTLISIIVSHVVTGFHLEQPHIEPIVGLEKILLYGAFPRILQYICCYVLLSILVKRYVGFLNSFYQVMEQEKENTREVDELLNTLTGREQDVFKLLVLGHTNAQIADQLCLSMGTVKNYVSIIYDKVNLRDRTALVLKYSQFFSDYDQSHT